MRVKKPTSKRTTTRMREGIKKKAAAQNRKNRKNAKKDVTWKSRVNKDPGIPASFPYKHRILEELEEQRRVEREKREALKLQKQQERAEALARGELVDDAMDQDDDEDDEEDDGQGGLAALLESAQQAAKKYDGDDDDEDEEDMEDEEDDVQYDLDITVDEDDQDHSEVDKSRRAYDKIFKTVVEAADVILYVLDARDPESTRSRKVEQAVLQNPGKRLILVLNKVDLIPTNVLNQWLNFLKSSFPTIPIKASPGSTGSNSFNKNLTSAMTSQALLQALKSYAAKSNLKRSIIVGVIGYPNVGKSSIINALTNRHGNNSKACPVGNQAGITTAMREVKIDNKLKVLDSPGIVFPDEIINTKKLSKVQQEAKLALLSALPPKQIIDPIPAVQLLLRKLAKDNEMADGLKAYYQLPALPSADLEEFSKQFLIHVARSRGRLGKGGIPNLGAAALSVLADWRDGRIIGWTLPKSSKATADKALEDYNPDAPKSSLRGDKEPPKVEQTTIVSGWAKEFDLDGLLGDNFGLEA
ncbi:P-loop containing nucleoside triphosphate hydrolase protein [Scheffersomyces coipomensis]|uniref:P-loop containing nucleoside triphosphate hydrolase protein n=1 Tax=Scheffersomyces coipomensis TaxID=1788519 RepID=UPI00315CF301